VSALPAQPGPRLGADGIAARLREALGEAEVQVRDDSHLHAGHAGAREGGHYHVALRSARFAGLGRMARHRLVYDALGPLGPQGIHALSIQARAPDEP
jgi:BolA family transcriptional regulator, general stress-responsive regulator